jgi:hypothetical protein
LFAQKFQGCLVTIVWKLLAQDQYELACVAEELAMHAIVRRAGVLLDLEGKSAAFSAVDELGFQDVDFMLLFDPALDGIEDAEIAGSLGVGYLPIGEWFTPFQNVRYVHPYVHDQ